MRTKEQRIIEDAAKLIGGRAQLAQELGMKENELADWIDGRLNKAYEWRRKAASTPA